MNYRSGVLFFIISALLPVAILPASELTAAEELFIRAVNEERGYNDAAAAFAGLLDEKTVDPGVLFYNLGNALYLDNDLLGALSAYGEALRYRPGNQDYLANRNLTLRTLELPLPLPSGTDYILHAPVLFLGLTGSLILLGGLLVVSLCSGLLFVAVRNDLFRSGSILLLILAAFLSVSVFTWEKQRSHRAVIKTEETVLHQGDNPLYAEVATLRRGTELRILEERAGWYLVRTLRTEDEKSLQGWLVSSSVLDISELIDTLR